MTNPYTTITLHRDDVQRLIVAVDYMGACVIGSEYAGVRERLSGSDDSPVSLAEVASAAQHLESLMFCAGIDDEVYEGAVSPVEHIRKMCSPSGGDHPSQRDSDVASGWEEHDADAPPVQAQYDPEPEDVPSDERDMTEEIGR